MIDYILHWLNNTHFLIFAMSILFFISILFNPLVWIPFSIYCIYVFISQPSYAEIEWYTYIRKYLYKFTYKLNQSYKHSDKFKIEGLENIEQNSKPVIFGFHPHGLISFTRGFFCTNQETELYKTHLKEAYHAIHSLLFKIPILREFILLGGAIPVSESYIRYYISKGHSITITPGGAREMKYTQDKYHTNGETYYIIPRKGISRIANDMNVQMIPVYTDGERQLFSYKESSIILTLIDKITGVFTKKRTDSNLIQMLSLRNILKWHNLYDTKDPITTSYIGKPTNTYQEYIDELKSLCKEANVNVKETQIK
jgi:hypothetical protein